MSLHQLIYQSREARPLSNQDFADILDVARKFNESQGVTGCLFYNGGWLLQVLEGEQTTIDNLYQKILKDERHKDCNLLYFEPVDKRVFSKWTMGMINLETEKNSKYSELKSAMEEFESGQVAIPLAIKLFRIFTHDFTPKSI
ncbi:BLUF domain-containing protein [Pseudoalteromonas sp. G4]|uniref:BLUF domain-containing protein n=1 Tax=Pseudoalteromonas sp. G4 TaxID=2992761 RepID=UPI00237DEE0B|nr:BLUF domain-containing protein [Pseudoalteromonas sp. G4]MDE3273794.1 BLUF domain-containing protein [Pseudoalteromonas sp. G4]